MIRVLEFPSNENLASFSHYLWQQGILHRISEEGGQQVLWLDDVQQAGRVREDYARLCSGELTLQSVRTRGLTEGLGQKVLGDVLTMPLSLSLIVLSIALSLAINFGSNEALFAWFNFVEFKFSANSLYFASLDETLASGQWWRLLSPIFLHFSPLHLVFNMMWLYTLGQRIERLQSARLLLILVVLIGLLANFTQYYFSQSQPLFGGFSGVVYGLLGYCWARETWAKDIQFGLPKAVMVFMLLWLFICYSGVLGVVGFGEIANAAHTAGLVSGALLGFILAKISNKNIPL